jgi:hypothetical protein
MAYTLEGEEVRHSMFNKLLRAVLSTAFVLMAVPAALAASPRPNFEQGTETAICAHAGLGEACAEDWNQENIAARSTSGQPSSAGRLPVVTVANRRGQAPSSARWR